MFGGCKIAELILNKGGGGGQQLPLLCKIAELTNSKHRLVNYSCPPVSSI